MEPENKLQSKKVETYAEDMAKAIDTSQAGLVKNIIHQEEEYDQERKNSSPMSGKNKFFIIMGILFMLLAVGLLVFLVISRKKTGTVEVQMQYTPIIFTDKTVYLEVSDLSKAQIAQSFLNEVSATDVKAKGLEGIYLTENKSIVGFSKFLDLIGSSLSKGVFADNFLLGASNQNTKDPFILIQSASFADAFNAMHNWEPKMFYDLNNFFGPLPMALPGAGGDRTSLLTKGFEDGIIQNKNARILYDDNNNIALMYIFADDTSVIITDSEDTAAELMLRLSASTIKK